MVDMAQRNAEQARYEARYIEHEERDRPRPRLEMSQIEAIARRFREGDASAALEWSLVTPQDFQIARAAERWDKTHPFYDCVHCHDGKDLPQGYVCQVCGADNPGRWDT